MTSNNKGSALVLAIILGGVLILGLSALIGTALNENRSTMRAAVSSMAFHLAEAGVDRATLPIKDASFTGWTLSGNTYTHTFTVPSADINGMTGSYKVVITKLSDTEYDVSSLGTVNNSGGKITAQRAVKVRFTRSSSSASGGGGMTSLGAITTASASGAISKSQAAGTYDSFSSAGNKAPSSSNRGNNCVVGTLSTANGALDLSNGQYYCKVAIGAGSTSSTTVKYAYDTNTKEILARVDDLTTAKEVDSNGTVTNLNDESTTYLTNNADGQATLAKRIARDLEYTPTDPIPPDGAGWTFIANSEINQSKLSQIPESGTAATTLASKGLKRSGNVITIGKDTSSKTYIVVGNFKEGPPAINVYGEAVIVTSGDVADANINYMTTDAKVTIYTTGSVGGGGGAVTSTQSTTALSAYDSTKTNYESKKINIEVLPNNFGSGVIAPNPTSTKYTTPDLLKSDYEKAYTDARAKGNAISATGVNININNNGKSTVTANLNAPFSALSISSDVSSNFCGSIVAKSIQLKGNNSLKFHYDESLKGGNSSTPSVAMSSWREILPTAAVFN